jgi:hypothetical protein
MAHLPNAPLPQALVALPANANAAPLDVGGSIVSEIHEFAIPAHAVTALDRLYGSMYASWRHLQLCGVEQPTPHSWIGYRHGEIIGVLLFRMRDSEVLVLTEMFRLDPEIAEAFCLAVFSRFAYTHQVTFNAVSVPRSLSPLPMQSYAFSENYIIELPVSVDDYLNALGKSTRKTIRGYGNRLQRELPGFRWEVRAANELRKDEQRRLVRQWQRFKQASMAARGKRAVIDRRDTARLLQLASECGLFGIASIDGRVVGGSLACRFGDNYVMLLSGADPALESYRLGMLCCFWSVCDCIRTGARQCHLLWGRYQYKRQLLGVPHVLQHITLYRSRWQMVLSPARVVRMSWEKLRHACRSHVMIIVRDRNDAVSRMVSWGLDGLRAAVSVLRYAHRRR